MIERVRAIIIEDKSIILVKRIKENETFWVLPGGAVENGEAHQEALKREVEEEIGVKVEVGKLFYKGVSHKPKTRGQTEYYYLCTIISGQSGTGQGPEFQPNSHYIGKHEIEWVELEKIPQLDLKPHEVKNLIINRFTAGLDNSIE